MGGYFYLCQFKTNPVSVGNEACWESSSYFQAKIEKKDTVAKTLCLFEADGVVVRASASKSVDLGFIPLVE